MDVAPVMGIAMGTSEAGGYVNADRNVLGWFNELAFAPVDLNQESMADPWSGDNGVGATYFSQDSVIKLAPAAEIELDEALAPAEKLKVVQIILDGADAEDAEEAEVKVESCNVKQPKTEVLVDNSVEEKTVEEKKTVEKKPAKKTPKPKKETSEHKNPAPKKKRQPRKKTKSE